MLDMAFSTKKGPNFGYIKWALAGWCFEIKLIPLTKVQTTPRPRRKWFVFWKNAILYQVEISQKTSTWYKIKFFQKTNHFLLGPGVVCTFAKGINFISKHHPARAHFIYPKFGPFFVENAIFWIMQASISFSTTPTTQTHPPSHTSPYAHQPKIDFKKTYLKNKRSKDHFFLSSCTSTNKTSIKFANWSSDLLKRFVNFYQEKKQWAESPSNSKTRGRFLSIGQHVNNLVVKYTKHCQKLRWNCVQMSLMRHTCKIWYYNSLDSSFWTTF